MRSSRLNCIYYLCIIDTNQILSSMLLRVNISNFLSFYNEVSFDMFPSHQRKGHINHIYTDHQIPLLKMGAIYGANNAGKSNFIKALKFIQQVVLTENYLSEETFGKYCYRLTDNSSSPIKIEVEFLQRQTYYIYSVQIDKVLHEKLLVSGIGRTEDKLVFQRDGHNIKGEGLTNKSLIVELLKRNPYTSLMLLNRKFPVINSVDVDNANTWFRDSLQVININTSIRDLIKLMESSPSLLEFADEMMRLLDISDALSIKKTDFEQWLSTSRGKSFSPIPTIPDNVGEVMASQNRRNEFHVISEQGKRKVLEFMFRQSGPEGKCADLDIDTQSDGTVRLLTLLPAIYNIMYNEKVVFIDEIENSMHPNMIYCLVKHFADSQTKGQLIFSTHLTRFQNQQDFMRVDEMWMAEKKQGMTILKSFNDYKIHNTINVENGYTLGRYGGVPTLGL